MSTNKILIVDDEEDIREILQFNLEHEGYRTIAVDSAEEALTLEFSDISLILLDVMMKGMSGFQMADKLRKFHIEIPIIFLTARDTENDMLTGFSVGADDYIKKPFSIKEVIARVKSALRRSGAIPPDNANLIIMGDLEMDTLAKTVQMRNKLIDVTRTEYEILHLLVSNEGRIFSRAEILDNVWDDESMVLERTIDVHIARLRKKLKHMGKNIHNRVGFGYSFKRNNTNEQ